MSSSGQYPVASGGAETEPRWLIKYHHRGDDSSWWGDELVRAADPEAAAAKCKHLLGHAHHSDPGLKVMVYGPIPDDICGKFWVRETVAVEQA